MGMGYFVFSSGLDSGGPDDIVVRSSGSGSASSGYELSFAGGLAIDLGDSVTLFGQGGAVMYVSLYSSDASLQDWMQVPFMFGLYYKR